MTKRSRQLVAILSSGMLAACAAIYGVKDVPPILDGDGGGAEGGDEARPGSESGADVAADARPDARTDAGPDGGTGAPPSCAPGGLGMGNCGADGGESCCTSLEVTGGTYSRTYTYEGGIPTGLSYPAKVSSFRLDKYEVTVGRFRQFVLDNAPAPGKGAGKHTYLNSGQGLLNSAPSGGSEPGWSTADQSYVQPTDTNLMCFGSTWTTLAGVFENDPINCVNWYEAYAFCIWDGGFLPSEAEWEYAAAGGSDERQYPWGSTDAGVSKVYAIYNCDFGPAVGDAGCYSANNIAPVGTATAGEGRWGQLDLAGNVWEWTLDQTAVYTTNCVDCAYFGNGSDRELRGGGFQDMALSALLPPTRNPGHPPDGGTSSHGFRCARAP